MADRQERVGLDEKAAAPPAPLKDQWYVGAVSLKGEDTGNLAIMYRVLVHSSQLDELQTLVVHYCAGLDERARDMRRALRQGREPELKLHDVLREMLKRHVGSWIATEEYDEQGKTVAGVPVGLPSQAAGSLFFYYVQPGTRSFRDFEHHILEYDE